VAASSLVAARTHTCRAGGSEGKDGGVASSTETPAPAVKWFGLTIDCADDEAAEQALRRFYLEALDGELVRGSAVRARGLLLIFQRVEGYRAPTWPAADTPKQMHFEWMVDDLAHTTARLEDLGASLANHQDMDDPTFCVMLDPAGHPFCLIADDAMHPDYRPPAT